jgi:pyruvate/2-oxoglutarate dehydrogenase complex dihydrolipoamide acyltransferase (E2) component
MMTEVKMPQHGSQMTDGDIIEWLVEEGSKVEKGQDIVEVEAAKASFTIKAPVSGTIKNIDAEEDDNINVGEVIATIESKD